MHNGWRLVEPARGGRNKYDKYANQIVVIVPKEKNQEHIVLTQAGHEALGKPDRVNLYMRGTNAAFTATADGGFKLSASTNTTAKTFYVSAARWRQDNSLKPGVYQAHIETGMLVFDTAQTPTNF